MIKTAANPFIGAERRQDALSELQTRQAQHSATPSNDLDRLTDEYMPATCQSLLHGGLSCVKEKDGKDGKEGKDGKDSKDGDGGDPNKRMFVGAFGKPCLLGCHLPTSNDNDLRLAPGTLVV